MSGPAYGIDFGTTNSAIAVAYEDGRVEVIDVEPGALPQMLPSMIYLDRDDLRLVGRDAARNFTVRGSATTVCSRCDRVTVELGGGAFSECRQFVPGGRCSDARLLTGLKYELADAGFRGTNSWAQDYPIVDLVTELLVRLKTRADDHVGVKVGTVSVGFPFIFHGAEGPDFQARQYLAKSRLVEAAHRAGFDDVQLVFEAQAAASVEEAEEGIVLTADFGGGTFDVAVINFDLDEPEVMSVEGAPVGGDLVDRGLVERFIAPMLGLDVTYRSQSGATLRLPNEVGVRAMSLTGVRRLMQDREVALQLLRMEGEGAGVPALQALLYGGQAFAFYDQVEQAKIALSDGRPEAEVRLQRLGINESVFLHQADLATVAAPLLDAVERAIGRALQQAGITTDDISYAVRTGGSSLLPPFVQMLNGLFGSDRVRQRDPFSTVVTGLALDALGR